MATWNRLVIDGIGVVIATPLRADGTVNEEEYRRHLRWLVKAGVKYIQPSAATGQVMQTSDEEYERLLTICVEECRGTGCLITAYPGRADTAHTIKLTQIAQRVGADAYYLVQPLFTRPDAEGLYAHYKAVIESAPGLPVALYNNPDRTSVNLPLEVIERLTDEYTEVVGVKQANPMELVETFRRLIHKIPVWSRGEFDLLTCLALGGPGSISFSGNFIAPQLVQIEQLWKAGKIEESRSLFYQMLPVIQACHWGPIPSTIKYMMRRTGWDVGGTRLPIVDVNEGVARRVEVALAQAGLI